jgi:hypothetical protein
MTLCFFVLSLSLFRESLEEEEEEEEDSLWTKC